MSDDKVAEAKTSVTKRKKATAAPRKAVKRKTTKRSKTSRKKATPTSKGGKRIRLRQVRSGVGCTSKVRRTLRALGLKHHQDEVVVQDNASVRGMVRRVHHLVSVIAEED